MVTQCKKMCLFKFFYSFLDEKNMTMALLMNFCDESQDKSLSFQEIQECNKKLSSINVKAAPTAEEKFNELAGDDRLLTLDEWQNPKSNADSDCCICVIVCIGTCC